MAVKLLNDLIEISPFRPVTPVGQLLFNEQKRATENAIFHKISAQERSMKSTAVVQSALDRALSPPAGWLCRGSIFWLSTSCYSWEPWSESILRDALPCIPRAHAPTRKKKIEQEHDYEHEPGSR